MGLTFPNTFFYEFVTLFTVLCPPATIPIFLAVTAGLDQRRALLVACYASSAAFLVLLFFIVAGQNLLVALNIPMESFQMAGSIVLLLFGLKMVLGNVIEEAEEVPENTTLMQRSIYPLAMPGIAGAGAMLTVVQLTDNNGRTIAEQAATTGVLAVCLAIFFVLFALSRLIFRLIGLAGIEIVSRVFGLILASIAVTNMIVAIKLSFGLG